MKKFYAGGFWFDRAKKLVLLHKRDTNTLINPDSWAFFGGLSERGETPLNTFIIEVQEELGINLTTSAPQKLTDYFNPDLNTHRFIYYVEVENESLELNLAEGESYGWFSLDRVLALNLTKRTRQDLLLFKKKLI